MTIHTREDSTEPHITVEAVVAQSLDAIVGLVKLTATLAAERDRYHDALVAIVGSGDPETSLLASEALESHRAG